MSHALLATEAELEALLGELAEPAAAALLLEIASDTVRQHADGQVLSLVEDDELTLRGITGRTLVLPQRPVVSVASITVDGVAVPASSYTVSVDGAVRLKAGHVVNAGINTAAGLDAYWGGPDAVVVATYTHGFDPIPPVVKGVVLDLVRRALLTPDAGAITQESLGSYSVTYARTVASTLTPEEERKLSFLRRRSRTLHVSAA